MQNKRTLKNIIGKITVAVFFLSFANISLAATLGISPASGNYSQGSLFSTSVFVNSSGESTNAVSGTLSFPKDLLEVVSISKAGSVVNFWAEEPSFSNAAGTVNFEGVVLNPGFTGAFGKILIINFRTKAPGTATANFNSGSVLANDGKGTNILKGFQNGSFSISGAQTQPTETVAPISNPLGPKALKISSKSNSDQSKWYATVNPAFAWELPSDAIAVKLSYDRNPNGQPFKLYEPAISKKELGKIADGVYYFHAQAKNNNGWGTVSHFRFQVDNTPPEDFEITFQDANRSDGPRPVIYFDAEDKMSGVESYEIKVDTDVLKYVPEDSSAPYTVPEQTPGQHTVLVRAIDRAGNVTENKADFEIVGINPPEIIYYSSEIGASEPLKIRGLSYPNSTIKFYLTDDNGRISEDFTKSNSIGDFSVVWSKKMEEGVYRLTAKVIDGQGAESPLTEPVSVTVKGDKILKFGRLILDSLSLIILLALVLIFLASLYWFVTHKLASFRQKLKAKIVSTESSIEDDFEDMTAEIENYITMLADAKTKRSLSREESLMLKSLQKRLSLIERDIKNKLKTLEKETD